MMTDVNNDEPTIEEMVKMLKHEDFQKMNWVETSTKHWIIVETMGVDEPYDIDIHHPGLVKFLDNGSLAIVGEGLPTMVINAGGWHKVTTVDYEEEIA